MKLTAILILLAALHVSATGHAQRVTISVKNASIENVFREIRKQTGYQFLYNNQMLDKAKKVSITIQHATLNEALDKCFANQPLTYEIVDRTIIIKVKQESPNADATNVTASFDVSGRITDSKGNAIPDANVMIKGTKRGTTTGNDGRFTIKAEEGNVLEITAIGFGKKEIKISGQQQIVVALEVVSSVLDEVQYIAYGTTSKRLSTSNITSVKAADIEKQPVPNPLLALQGRVPGLYVAQPSGLSGTGVKVRIQGQNSLGYGSDPLYVVDGVPIDAELPRIGFEFAVTTKTGGYGSPLNYINPLDIESIYVLKDADATAIYGSRAANGAILITTKKGKAGVMKVDANMQAGWGKMTRRLEMMNTRQYLDMRYEAFTNDNIDWRRPEISANDLKVWDTTSYTNWQDELLGGTAHYSDVNAAISGGSETIRYLISGTYHKETTVFPFPEFNDQKAGAHFSLNANNSNQKLKMQFSGNYIVDNNRLPYKDITERALLMEPNSPPLLNADGSINWAPDKNGNSTLGDADVNVMVQRYSKYENRTYNLLSNIKLDYTILPGLSMGTTVGYNHMQTNDYLPGPLVAVAPEQRANKQRSANFGERKIQLWTVDPQLSYRTTVKNGSFDILIGSSLLERTTASSNVAAIGQLSDDLLDNINNAARIIKGVGGSSSAYRYTAVFGRAGFNWANKYIINVNARRDGSTRFGGDNRFHSFGSIGGAWIFSSEDFFKRYANVISFGKLRGSYGTTGNDQIGDYLFMSLYRQGTASDPYQGIVGLVPERLPNPMIQWEETRKLQVGVDVGLFADRIIINTTFARNRSSNQLLSYPLPDQAGFESYIGNVPATIQNRSWEVAITGKIFEKKNLTWTSSINFTLPQNKLIDFPGLAGSGYANKLIVGQPIDILRCVHWLGVAPGTGQYFFADKKGNPTITPNPFEDNTALISMFPKCYGGFENTITYKSIQLYFIFQFVKQTGYNDFAFFNGIPGWFPGKFGAGLSNAPATLVDRWQQPGDANKPVARYSTTQPPFDPIASDRRYTDASFIRLKTVSLSWDIPQKWLQSVHFRNVQVYLHAQNLLTFTHYKGLDPEAQSLSLPPLQVCIMGIKLGL